MTIAIRCVQSLGLITLAFGLNSALSGYSSENAGVLLAEETLPTLSINDARLKKSEAGTAQVFFTVTLSSPSNQTVTIQYATADGTATAGTDYVHASGTLTFVPRTTQERILVLVTGRNTTTTDKTFFVQLSNPANATISRGRGVGTITSDFLAITLQFSKSSFTVSENTGSALITVTRTGSSSATVSVRYATSDGTATAGSDYVATSGSLTFAAGETSKTFAVSIIPDNLAEESEAVQLNLSNPTGGATLGTPSAAVLVIQNARISQPGSLQFTAVSGELSEGAGSALVTVVRRNGSDGTVSVKYSTSDVTAKEGLDYIAASGTLIFAPKETTKTFSVTIIDDDLVEDDETIILSLSNPAGGATLGTPSTAVLKIIDNDKAKPLITGITPRYGDPAGGSYVKISGRNFISDAIVRFGNELASNIRVFQNTVIVCTTPAGSGTVDVSVTTTSGTATLAAAFTYVVAAPQGNRLEWFAPDIGESPTSFSGDTLPPPRHLKATRVRSTNSTTTSQAPEFSAVSQSAPEAVSGSLHLLGYNVYRSSDPTFVVSDPSAQLIVNIPAGTNSYFDQDPETAPSDSGSKGPTSFYRVTAVYEQGASLWTNIASPRVTVTGVSIQKIDDVSTLVVEGVSFATFRSRIQIDGVTLGQTTYPKSGRLPNGTSTRIEGVDDFNALAPVGKTVSIVVFNPGTEEDLGDAEFSIPFSVTRTK